MSCVLMTLQAGMKAFASRGAKCLQSALLLGMHGLIAARVADAMSHGKTFLTASMERQCTI